LIRAKRTSRLGASRSLKSEVQPTLRRALTNGSFTFTLLFFFACRRKAMRPFFCIFALALAWLITSSAQAHSRGFAWFFAHSKPHGTCSGQHVVATFYASGRRTASGQTFDPSGYTAAHRTLLFGSRVTVTNPQNGNSVTVVINDRGPFTRGVTLDLSRGAARAIGMHRTQWLCML
jgi:rare lipoprotein A